MSSPFRSRKSPSRVIPNQNGRPILASGQKLQQKQGRRYPRCTEDPGRHFALVAKSALLATFATVLVLAAACGSKTTELTVRLLDQENSGQSGIATLKADGPRTQVALRIDAGPSAADPQPVHIHFGRCGDRLGGVEHALSDIAGGQSSSLVEASLESLMDGNHAINVHKSYSEIAIYTSCGNIPSQ